MTQKFVIRLLTEEGDMLGWCQHQLKPVPSRAEGCTRFGPRGTVSEILITKAGVAMYLSIHWCDIDCARKVPLLGGPMQVPESAVGTIAKHAWAQSIWGVSGNTGVPLPPVTVGEPVVLSPDPAQIGAASQ